MSVIPYYILILIIMAIGTIATVRVGNSKANKEGNPEYDRRTSGYWRRLSLFYTIAAVVGFSALAVYLIIK